MNHASYVFIFFVAQWTDRLQCTSSFDSVNNKGPISLLLSWETNEIVFGVDSCLTTIIYLPQAHARIRQLNLFTRFLIEHNKCYTYIYVVQE